MKTKWLELTWPQRVMLLLQGFLMLLFLVLYLTLGRQQVIEYRDEYLRCQTDGGTVTYSGRIDGRKVVLTVTGNTLECRVDKTLFGPYSVAEDSTAIPPEDKLPLHITSADALTGVEVRSGNEVLFRGSYMGGLVSLLFDEQGEQVSLRTELGMKEVAPNQYVYTTAEPTVEDYAPRIHDVILLVTAPDVAQRSHFGIWWLASLFCVLNAISVLYADSLFRWNLRFRIRDAEQAEPSEWELFSRWVGWIVITIMALVIYILGLNYH